MIGYWGGWAKIQEDVLITIVDRSGLDYTYNITKAQDADLDMWLDDIARDRYPFYSFIAGDITSFSLAIHEEKRRRFRGSWTCEHEYVNVGFTHIKMVCKNCDKNQDNT